MRRFFAIAAISLFLGAVGAPVLAQQPQKACCSQHAQCSKKDSEKKVSSEADKKATDQKAAKKTTRRSR